MNSLQTKLLEMTIKDFDSELQPRTKLLGNGEWIIVLYGRHEYHVWNMEDWVYIRDNWLHPLPYHSPASHKTRQSRNNILEGVAV
jgi:hypothetical protein